MIFFCINRRILDVYIINKAMIRNFLKPTIKVVQAASFSTYRPRDVSKINENSGNLSQQGYMESDAQRVFEQFFKQNPPKQSEKTFFDMNYGRKEQTHEMNPYEVLGVKPTDGKQKIKAAYRELALQYHPKKNSSMQAHEKFINISRAYQILNSQNDTSKQISYSSQFNNNVKDLLSAQIGSSLTMKDSQKHKIHIAEVYSEQTNVKKVGDHKQVTIQKQYNKDGKIMYFTRVQKHNPNGTIEISQNFDDGVDVKVNKFVQDKSGQILQLVDKKEKDNKDKNDKDKQNKQKKQQKKEKDAKQKKIHDKKAPKA